MNGLGIVYESVLARKVEASSNTGCQEYFAVVVIALKGVVHLFKALRVMNVAVRNVRHVVPLSSHWEHILQLPVNKPAN